MFWNKILKIIFGPKHEEITGCWRKSHDEYLHYFYSSSNIIKLIKLRRMSWTLRKVIINDFYHGLANSSIILCAVSSSDTTWPSLNSWYNAVQFQNKHTILFSNLRLHPLNTKLIHAAFISLCCAACPAHFIFICFAFNDWMPILFLSRKIFSFYDIRLDVRAWFVCRPDLRLCEYGQIFFTEALLAVDNNVRSIYASKSPFQEAFK